MWRLGLIGEEAQGLAGERRWSNGSEGSLGEAASVAGAEGRPGRDPSDRRLGRCLPPTPTLSPPPNPGISGASVVAEEA